ncbi:MAG: type II toxin-antitoxin system VapC family toxin [Alphaproteobacteria bacterium]|nr:type II toxin-antitoxin system VapC family toxin [Alphaproteobacteria bacterium]
MPYLLDTNIVSDIIRNPQGQAAKRLRNVGIGQACVSLVVCAELRYGAEEKNALQLKRRVEEFLRTIRMMPLDGPADRIYATIRVKLKREGRIIGQNDLFTAAHALALDYVLVTDNEEEFSRVPGLRIENWLR